MSAFSDADTAQTSQAQTPRGPSGWTVLLVLLLLVLAVFLVFPSESFSSHPWVLALQTQLRTGVTWIGPYGIVMLIGGIVGLAEISSTFPNYPREALLTRWAQILILVNALAAALAFWIARIYVSPENLGLLIVGVGVGFQALIRTRFTLAKQIGGSGGDVELNLGWLYDQFQRLCKTQIDLELMQGRRTAVTRLLERYPTLADLYSLATYTVLARATLTPQEREERLAVLEKLFDSKAPVHFTRAQMALSILENGGQAYVDLLLTPPGAGAPAAPTPASVAKQLIDKYSLAELVNMTKRMTDSPEVHAWVEQAAQPTADMTETQRKAAIAQLLVQRAGAEAVQKEMEKQP